MTLLVRFAISGLCIVMSSCTIVPLIELYNRTDSQVRVAVGSDTDVVPSSAIVSFDYPSADLGQVQICLNRRWLKYTVPFPPDSYYHGIALLFLRSRIRVQLNADGRIWILKRGEGFPVRESADQPGPFPLSPEQGGIC